MTRGGGNLCALRRSKCHFYSLNFVFQLDFNKSGGFLLPLKRRKHGRKISATVTPLEDAAARYNEKAVLPFCGKTFLRQKLRLEKPTMAESIQLSNGHSVQLDRENWTGMASQECDCLTATGRNITPRLAALKHTDGRVVVFATVKDGQKTSAAGGELLTSQEAKPLAAALGRLAAQFSRGPFLLKQCLSQIGTRPVV
jgi:hypothetical protein